MRPTPFGFDTGVRTVFLPDCFSIFKPALFSERVGMSSSEGATAGMTLGGETDTAGLFIKAALSGAAFVATGVGRSIWSLPAPGAMIEW